MAVTLIQTTVPEETEGQRLADKLLNEKLAACVWVMPAMHSHYNWKGKRECDREHLVIIKTLTEKSDDVYTLLLQEHSYECPEIISLTADRVSEGYLGFMRRELEGRS
ncbi:MAG: divalent-cation tolerance protein CutA [Verrucomicrobiota bacterium]